MVRNIKEMYECGDGHVYALAASLRRLEHLLYAFFSGAELATAPAQLLQEWATTGFPQPRTAFKAHVRA